MIDTLLMQTGLPVNVNESTARNINILEKMLDEELGDSQTATRRLKEPEEEVEEDD